MAALKDQHIIIASGETVSTLPIDRDGLDIIGFKVPAMTSETITFKGGDTDVVGDADVLSFEGTDVSFAVSTAATRLVSCHPDKFWACRYIWIVAAGAEGAARTIRPKFRGFSG